MRMELYSIFCTVSIVIVILISTVDCQSVNEQPHYRSRARHVLVARTNLRRHYMSVRNHHLSSPIPHRPASQTATDEITRFITVSQPLPSQQTAQPSLSQQSSSHASLPSQSSPRRPLPSQQLANVHYPTLTQSSPSMQSTTQEIRENSPASSPLTPILSTEQPQSRRRVIHIPTRRRGSQNPDVSYSDGDWTEIQRRLSNHSLARPSPRSPTISTRIRNRPGIRQYRPVVRQQYQGGTTEGQAQGQNNQNNQHGQRRNQGQGSPFYNKMSAFDYLTRRGSGNILQNANTRINRELNRIMGEGMCEAFGKHFVPISIGGKCM